MLAVVVIACGSANGGRDEKMFDGLVFNNKLQSNKGIIQKVLSPPFTALGLNRSRLASLHLLSLGPSAMC
jgi:hypothetical protein